MIRRSFKRAVEDDQGVSLVIVAVGMTTFLLMAVLAVDVANWFVHERHLQTQADAAALAAVQQISYPNCNDDNVLTQAKVYGGLIADPSSVPSTVRNQQVGGTSTSNIHLGDDSAAPLNKATYYGYPSNGPSPDNTDTRTPCAAGAVDVKLTETNLPSFFPFGLVKYINAHARAETRQRRASADAAPIGIPNSAPREVYVWLVDESGAKCGGTTNPRCVVAGQSLVSAGTLSGGLGGWTSPTGSPLNVAFSGVGSKLSLVVALSGNKPGTLTGVMATDCARTLVTCFDPSTGSPPNQGLPFVHTYSVAAVNNTSSSRDAPLARDVRLTGSTCSTPDAYFSICSTGTEQVTMEAAIDFDSSTSADPRGTAGTDVAVVAHRVGSNTDYPMTYDSSAKVWRATLPAPNAGQNDFSMDWTVNKGTIGGQDCVKRACTGSFGVVQRAFVGTSTNAGTIQLAQIGEPSGPAAYATFGANSFARCASGADPSTCTHQLSVTIGLTGRLTNDTLPNDPPLKLRFGSSQTGLIQCDPRTSSSSTTVQTDLAVGCVGVRYTKFTGVAPWDGGCPNNSSNLGGYPFDWQCVGTQNGATPQNVGAGMNARILCKGILSGCNPTTCTSPNNWKDPVTGIAGKIDPTDPRVVTLFITPYGSFQSSGSETFPIQDFGTFYITGWQGQGANTNPCQPGSPVAPTGVHADDLAGAGEVVGHYFKSIDPVDNGEAGDDTCDPAAFGGCVSILTK